jgi:hypothetical protein
VADPPATRGKEPPVASARGTVRPGEVVDGAVVLVDGAVVLVDGAVVLVDGAVVLVDGAVVLVDGAVVLVDGAVVLVDGAVVLVDGPVDVGCPWSPCSTLGGLSRVGLPPAC